MDKINVVTDPFKLEDNEGLIVTKITDDIASTMAIDKIMQPGRVVSVNDMEAIPVYRTVEDFFTDMCVPVEATDKEDEPVNHFDASDIYNIRVWKVQILGDAVQFEGYKVYFISAGIVREKVPVDTVYSEMRLFAARKGIVLPEPKEKISDRLPDQIITAGN